MVERRKGGKNVHSFPTDFDQVCLNERRLIILEIWINENEPLIWTLFSFKLHFGTGEQLLPSYCFDTDNGATEKERLKQVGGFNISNLNSFCRA